MNHKLYIHGYVLVLGSFACPQQFDVFEPNGDQAGYIRIRHGRMIVDCPDYCQDRIMDIEVKGDGILTREETMPRLTDAIVGIQNWIFDEMYKSVN